MKKIVIIALAAITMILTGCGGGSGGGDEAPQYDTSVSLNVSGTGVETTITASDEGGEVVGDFQVWVGQEAPRTTSGVTSVIPGLTGVYEVTFTANDGERVASVTMNVVADETNVTECLSGGHFQEVFEDGTTAELNTTVVLGSFPTFTYKNVNGVVVGGDTPWQLLHNGVVVDYGQGAQWTTAKFDTLGGGYQLKSNCHLSSEMTVVGSNADNPPNGGNG